MERMTLCVYQGTVAEACTGGFLLAVVDGSYEKNVNKRD